MNMQVMTRANCTASTRLPLQGAGLSVGQENTVNELLRDKDELSAERDRQVAAIVSPHCYAVRSR